MELIDVWVAVGLLAVTALAVFSAIPPRLRVLAVIPTLFLLPGYALTTLVFPKRTHSRRSDAPTAAGKQGISHWERAALAFGASVIVLPLLGVALSAFSLTVTAISVFLAVSTVTVLALAGGIVRRSRYSDDVRYVPPGTTPLRSRQSTDESDGSQSAWRQLKDVVVGDSDGRADTVLTGALIIVVLVAASSFVFVATAPSEAASYTETSLLTEQPNGNLVAENYPTTFELGESAPLILSVENNERESVSYTVVVKQQQLAEDGSVVERETLQTEQRTLEDGEQWQYDHTLEPAFAGGQSRIVYLVYRGEPPVQQAVDNAHQHLSLSISVEE